MPVCAARAQSAYSQISGRVVAADTGAPIAHARVFLDTLGISHNAVLPSGLTDKDGTYHITGIKTDSYVLTAEAESFVTQLLQAR